MIDIKIENISPSNLFREVGQKDYVFTITIKQDVELYKTLGAFISAKLVYSKNERENFAKNDDLYINTYSKGIIKIEIISDNLTVNEKLKYKLDGIKCSDINEIFFIPYSTNTMPNEEGVKIVPNIITIPYKSKSKFEYENMFCGFYSRLISKNEPLIFEEKIEYVAIESAFNGGRTSSKLLSALCITLDDIQKNSLFWKIYYETKVKISGLNKNEQKDYENHKGAIWFRKLRVFLTELLKGGKILDNNSQLDDKIDILLKELEKFKSSRFNFQYPLIYWDLGSYLHIILRHIQETKISENNLLKSNIPYRINDLKTLIERILDILEEEIEEHFKTKKELKFFRSGKRAVYFNGDYFSIDIDTDGKILAFYKN